MATVIRVRVRVRVRSPVRHAVPPRAQPIPPGAPQVRAAVGKSCDAYLMTGANHHLYSRHAVAFNLLLAGEPVPVSEAVEMIS